MMDESLNRRVAVLELFHKYFDLLSAGFFSRPYFNNNNKDVIGQLSSDTETMYVFLGFCANLAV